MISLSASLLLCSTDCLPYHRVLTMLVSFLLTYSHISLCSLDISISFCYILFCYFKRSIHWSPFLFEIFLRLISRFGPTFIADFLSFFLHTTSFSSLRVGKKIFFPSHFVPLLFIYSEIWTRWGIKWIIFVFKCYHQTMLHYHSLNSIYWWM